MATVNFKDPSPYTTPAPQHSRDDFLYTNYQSSFKRDNLDSKGSKEIVAALFGVGRAGLIHLSNIRYNPRVKLIYVVDDMEEKWDSLKKYWNLQDATFLTSKQASKVYEDKRVDAVFVASPTYTHEEIVGNALKNGKAVFCEKPIAGDIESTARIYNLADKMGKPLFSAFNRRFDPSFSHLRDEIRAGKIGHVHTIKICSRDSPLPTIDYLKLSGGIFHDCAVHDFDMMCWILGELPIKVFAAGKAHIPEIAKIDDYDNVAMLLIFPSGTIGMIDLSRNSSYGYDQRIEAFGPRGMVQSHNENPMSGYDTHLGLEGIKKTPIYYSFPSRYKLAYHFEVEHFLNVVEGTEKLSVLGRETLAVSKIASAMEESAKTGKHVDIKWEPHELPSN